MRHRPAAEIPKPEPTPNPAAGTAAVADVLPDAANDTDFAGWHVSSFELRRGLTVVDSDDPQLRSLFGL